jgi:hypothetical protein
MNRIHIVASSPLMKANYARQASRNQINREHLSSRSFAAGLYLTCQRRSGGFNGCQNSMPVASAMVGSPIIFAAILVLKSDDRNYLERSHMDVGFQLFAPRPSTSTKIIAKIVYHHSTTVWIEAEKREPTAFTFTTCAPGLRSSFGTKDNRKLMS